MSTAFRTLLVAVLLAGTPTLAEATEWLDCSDATDTVQLGFLLGGDDFAQQSRVHLKIGETWWSSDPVAEPGGGRLDVESFSFDWKRLSATVLHTDNHALRATIEVLVAEEGNEIAKGGVMTISGKGAWVVACDGP